VRLSPETIESVFPPKTGDPRIDKAALDWFLRWRLLEARPNQLPPSLDEDWTVWAAIAGRGYGKTRLGAETVGQWAWQYPGIRIAVVAPTGGDLRGTIFEGESGLVNVIPRCLIKPIKDGGLYNKQLFELELINGSLIKGMSAENPERLRGGNWGAIWCDELCAWQRMQASWDMLMFALRLKHGEWHSPRAIVTTTPKPMSLIRKMVEGKLSYKCKVSTGSSLENMDNLADSFRAQLMQYEGTQLGRQEIYGEVLSADEGAVIRRSWWNLRTHPEAVDADGKHIGIPLPQFTHIVMSIDTAFTEDTRQKEDSSDGSRKGDPDPTGCTVWGYYETKKGKGAILLDAWQERLGFPDLVDRVKRELKVRYGSEEQKPRIRPLFGPRSLVEAGHPVDTLLIEEKGSGISLLQVLRREGIDAKGYNPGKADKLTRLHSVSHVFKDGMIYALESRKKPGQVADHLEECIDQVSTYRGKGTTEHDDFVDSTSMAIRYIADMAGISVTIPKKKIDDDDAQPLKKRKANPYG
jgi:predicted phage terminase large subunit-like protein